MKDNSYLLRKYLLKKERKKNIYYTPAKELDALVEINEHRVKIPSDT